MQPMKQAAARGRTRSGFTLVEVLTVIAIIGILVGLLAVTFGPVKTTVLSWRIKSEITQLSLAMETVRTQLGGGDYPPDGTNQNDTLAWLNRAFPRANLTVAQVSSLKPWTALTFWLGGMQDTQGNFIGFSADPTNPFDTANPSRIGPFFDFDRARLVNYGTAPFAGYVPQSSVTNGDPYVYYKAVGRKYLTVDTSYYKTGANASNGKGVARPFGDSNAMDSTKNGTLANTDAKWVWVNPTSFQLLSPGVDGKFGDTGIGAANKLNPWYPSGPYGANMPDNITNFSNGRIESDLPN